MAQMLRVAVFVAFAAICLLVIWRWQINGWGSFVWLSSAILMTVIRAPYAEQNKSNTISGQYAVSTERVLLALVAIGGTVLPLAHLTTGAFAFANYPLPKWAPLIGLALQVPGFWLFWRSHADLGRNWSVTTELREDHSLTTTGVYSHIRHPMYSAIWLIFASYPFLIHNWIAGLAALLTFGLMYFIRVPIEEGMMRDQFGEAYTAYCARTGRLLPKLKSKVQ